MSRVTNLFKKEPDVILPNKLNFDGFPAFSVGIKEQYAQLVMVNTVGNTYYMDQKKLFEYSLALHKKMVTEDPVFAAKALVYGRTSGLMRTQPVLGLAFLSTIPDKSHFHAVFNKVIATPGDLLDFVSIATAIRPGLGRSVKKAINNWLNNMSQYHAIKYGGKSSSKAWTLRDVLKLARPIPKGPTQSALFKYIVDGTPALGLSQIMAIEELKRVSNSRKEYTEDTFATRVSQIVEAGRLPYEIVTGILKPNLKIWESLMKQMPIFALVRNLNTLDKASVFASRENVAYVVSKLNDVQTIKNSKMLPFRFSTAHNEFKGPVEISNALEKALDISLANLDPIAGDTAWFLDVSGSMDGEYLEVGSLLGIAGVKRSVDSSFLCFSTSLKYPRINAERSVMSNMQAVKDVFGGGTNIEICINYLIGTNMGVSESRDPFSTGYDSLFPVSLRTIAPKRVDNIVIITDEQQNSGTPLIKRFREYRRTVNRNAKLFIIDVAPYDSRIANENEPGVTFIYGWNDTVLDVLKLSSQGYGSHVDQISRM